VTLNGKPTSAFGSFCSGLPRLLGVGCRWVRDTLTPSLSVALVNVTAILFLFFAMSLLWLYVRPSPFVRVELVHVDPPDRTVDRSKRQGIVVTRRLTMLREAEIRVVRSWIDAAGAITPLLDDWLVVPAGVSERPPVAVYPPTVLNPGAYRYRIILESCLPIVGCDRYHPPDIEVLVIGQPPVPDRIDFQDRRF